MPLASQVGGWADGVWNEVFVGTVNAPTGHCGMDPETGAKPFVTIPASPLIADALLQTHSDVAMNVASQDPSFPRGMVGTAEEKPFISISSSGCFPANVLRVSECLQIFIVQLCSFVA